MKPGIQILNSTRWTYRIKWRHRMDITVTITTIIMVRQRRITLAASQIQLVRAVIRAVVVENLVMKMTVSVAVWLAIAFQRGKNSVECFLIFFLNYWLLKCGSHSGIVIRSSGKSQPGINQYSAILKAILAELQERREDCDKVREKLERLEVSQKILFIHRAMFDKITQLRICYVFRVSTKISRM